jgi:hypothetical protein
MLSPLALMKAGFGAASTSSLGEQRFVDLEATLPVYIAHFQRLGRKFNLPADDPLLRTAARLVNEALEACGEYRAERSKSGVVKAVNTAKQIAGGVVGMTSWEETFAVLLQRLQVRREHSTHSTHCSCARKLRELEWQREPTVVAARVDCILHRGRGW